MPDLRHLVSRKTTLRIRYQDGNVNNATIHVRAFVDETAVVYKVFRKGRGWVYEVRRLLELWTLASMGHLFEGDKPVDPGPQPGQEGA